MTSRELRRQLLRTFRAAHGEATGAEAIETTQATSALATTAYVAHEVLAELEERDPAAADRVTRQVGDDLAYPHVLPANMHGRAHELDLQDGVIG